MKTAVITGAGNIGRGFIGQIMHEGGYKPVFLDVAAPVVDALNAEGGYPLDIVSRDGAERRIISPVSAVNGNDHEAAARAIADCDIAVTCVGAKALKYTIPNLAAGIRLRFKENKGPLDLLICENLMDADEYIRSLLRPELTDEELGSVGLVETSVGRMVPLPDPKLLEKEPLLVRAESYGVLPCDRDAFKGEIPDIPALYPVSPFRFIIERKLYIHNMGHAVCAYLGMAKGYDRIAQAIGDPEIRLVVSEAMKESAAALAKRHGMPLDALLLHCGDLIRRFGNTALGDTCARVGNDIPRKLAKSDRLTGAALSCAEAGYHPTFIAVGAAAALRACETSDPVKDLEALTSVTEGEYHDDALGFYKMMTSGATLSDIIARADMLKTERYGRIV